MDFAPRWFVFDIAWPEPKRVLATHARALLEQWDTAGTLISTVVTEFEGRQLFVTSDRQRVLVTSADRPRWRGHRRWDWRAQLDCVSLDNGSRERIDAGQGTRVVSMSNDGHLLARNPAHHRSDQNTTDTDRYFVMAPDGHVVGAPAISNGGGVRRSEDLRIDGGPDLYVVAVEESSVSGRLSEYVGDQLCAIEPATLSVRTLFPVEWDPYRNTVVAAHAGLYVADADGQAIVLACEVSAGSALPLRHGQRALVRRALPDGDALWAMPFDSEISALIEMRDLDAIAFATIEGLLGAVDRATGDLLCCERFVADGVPCTGLSLAAWGTQLAVGTLDGRIFLYDAQRIRGAP